MSRTAKATFLLSAALSTVIVVGVHYQQTAERETMYQGVLKDQARLEAKRAAAAAAAAEGGEPSSSSSSSGGSGIVAPPLPPSQATPEARYQDWLRNREREEEFQRIQPTKAFLERQRQEEQLRTSAEKPVSPSSSSWWGRGSSSASAAATERRI